MRPAVVEALRGMSERHAKPGRWVLTCSLVVLLLAACTGSSRTVEPPPGGISRSRAVELALREAGHVSDTRPKFVSAEVGRIGNLAPWVGPGIAPSSEWVWSVEVSGTFTGTCGPPGNSPCPGPNHSALVFLDYMTGRWLTTRTQ